MSCCAVGGSWPGKQLTPQVKEWPARIPPLLVPPLLPLEADLSTRKGDDERVLHTTPFRSSPSNICTSQSSHVRGTMAQAASSRARSWACCRSNTRTDGWSGDARLEVHSATPMLLLHPSNASNCAAGGTRPVRTQDDSGAPTVGVIRAHWRSGGRFSECRQDRNSWKSHRSTMNVCCTPRHFGQHLQIFAPRSPHAFGGR